MGLPRFRRVKGARSYGSTRLEAAIEAAAHALVMRRKQSGRSWEWSLSESIRWTGARWQR